MLVAAGVSALAIRTCLAWLLPSCPAASAGLKYACMHACMHACSSCLKLPMPSAGAELDVRKHAYQGLPHHLTHCVEAELARVPRVLIPEMQGQSWSMQYMPQVPLLRPASLSPGQPLQQSVRR